MKIYATRLLSLAVLSTTCCFGNQAWATFHFMQIEQVIGGVNGDTTAQAIQLRLRSGGQNNVGGLSEINVRDAAGANPVELIDFPTSPSNGSFGSRILITTPNFANYTDIPLVSDFTMNPIPASYLAAGQIAFENNAGGKLWNLNYGGASYTGTTTGLSTNDGNGDFGPAFGGPLPTSSLSALLFSGAANALSTTNLADYALTPGAATFFNNAGTSFSLVAPAPDSANFNGDDAIDGADFLIWQRGFGSPGGLADGDANNSGNVDGDDLDIWKAQYGLPIALSSISAIPEPQSVCLLLSGLMALCGRRRQAE